MISPTLRLTFCLFGLTWSVIALILLAERRATAGPAVLARLVAIESALSDLERHPPRWEPPAPSDTALVDPRPERIALLPPAPTGAIGAPVDASALDRIEELVVRLEALGRAVEKQTLGQTSLARLASYYPVRDWHGLRKVAEAARTNEMSDDYDGLPPASVSLLSVAEVLERFGPPTSVSRDSWYYDSEVDAAEGTKSHFEVAFELSHGYVCEVHWDFD